MQRSAWGKPTAWTQQRRTRAGAATSKPRDPAGGADRTIPAGPRARPDSGSRAMTEALAEAGSLPSLGARLRLGSRPPPPAPVHPWLVMPHSSGLAWAPSCKTGPIPPAGEGGAQMRPQPASPGLQSGLLEPSSHPGALLPPPFPSPTCRFLPAVSFYSRKFMCKRNFLLRP